MADSFNQSKYYKDCLNNLFMNDLSFSCKLILTYDVYFEDLTRRNFLATQIIQQFS